MADRPARSRTQRYAPLTGALVAALLAVFVLPSALNVPQSNPTQTLEFAPIPPEDQDVPPPQGNVDALSLGSSDTAPGDAADGGGPGLPPPPPVPEGSGDVPIAKRCVGDPPRQTEDPMSPPCVGYFDGDNGGATYRGVASDEIRVVAYLPARFWASSRGMEQTPPAGSFFDLGEPPDDTRETDPWLRVLRAYQRYFNVRYQTYDRFVHFFAYYGTSSGATPEERRSDAAEVLERADPFAALSFPGSFRGNNEQPFFTALANQGVLNFGSAAGRTADFYRRFPGLVWGYNPSVEQQAASYISFVCRRVVPFPVSFTGEQDDLGQPRELGLIGLGNEDFVGLVWFKELVRDGVTECGGEFVAEASVPSHGWAGDSQNPPVYATTAMAEFEDAGVTTVIWAQGYETEMSKAAGRIDYHPEWVIAGDGFHEGQVNGQIQDQDVWRHAWTVTPVTREAETIERPCERAVREGAPNFGDGDMHYACLAYKVLRQLFIGVQVAGPRINPDAIDRGFHAIPALPSTSPFVPACFYDPGDYTCVKDAVAQWYDPDAESESSSAPGCWRMPEDGRRFLRGGWPEEDVPSRASPQDPCNAYSAGTSFR